MKPYKHKYRNLIILRLHFLFAIIIFSILSGCSVSDKDNQTHQKDLAQFVDPLIGTGGTGHTFPGAVLPFGMVQLSPDTDIGTWKRCSGYHASDSTIAGFSLTHLSGTGNGDLGDVMLMPTIGSLRRERGTSDDPDAGYRSRFSKDTERAEPGYYSVMLDDYSILAELTVSKRVGFHRYTLPASDSVHLIMDMTHRVERDRSERVWSYFQYNDSVSISGYTISHGWAKDRHIYWAIKTSKPFERPSAQNIYQGKDLRAIMHFTSEKDEQLLIKAAYSPLSISNARKNLNEISHWDFDQVKMDARETWNKELNKIQIETSPEGKTLFYTGMYRTMIHPSLFTDINGEFRAIDKSTRRATEHEQYTVFSLWDTYRALHPLQTILQPERNKDFVYSMLNHYKHNPYNILPIWELHGNETWTMIGYHAIPVITDAFFKGLINRDDAPTFLNAMVQSANKHPYGGIDEYLEYGYVPVSTKTKEPVSMTLEYAYDDWCIAKMAEALEEKEIATTFYKRSQSYQNLFDPVTRFMRAKDTLGNWATRSRSGIFNPFLASWRGDYTEGNAWQYTWYVPHNIPHLISLMGGEELFAEKLDSLFMATPQDNNYQPRDITGMIGQYAHGNEPSHHICYLYNYVGKPFRTQEKINDILNNFYLADRDGIIGNEDCGQMSAWYVFSALGFYPVNPASGVYVLGKPHVSKASIQVNNQQSFNISAINLSDENIYIEKVELNGEPYEKNWIGHESIMQGGEIIFHMTDSPSKWGTSPDAYPVESIY